LEQLTALTSSATRPVAAFAAAGLLLFAAESFAAARRAAPPVAACPAAGSQELHLSRALAGDRFASADGSEVRLTGIVVARTAEPSRLALSALLANRRITIAPAATPRDRYGRLQGQVFADGVWIQAALLREGAALAAPDLASGPCAAMLLAAEDEARRTRRGGWYNRAFDVLSVDALMREAGRRAGTFQVFEGRVVTAAVIRGRAYLNFGEDYRRDVTVTIAPEDMREFRRQRVDPRKLAGAVVRVRGWVELFNGPNIAIATPGALEILEAAAPGQ
jgi:endonuclease YncB( thermonuclease family)